MATLIGCGSHARDILLSGIRFTHQVCHHTMYAGEPWDSITIGVNNPWIRDEIAKTLGKEDWSWEHPTAHISESSWKGGTHINANVTIIRTKIGHHVTISPGVTICGDVTIGNRCLIGAGATICDRVTIGDDVTVGAGAVVLPESVVDSNATIIGVPARYADGRPVK